MQIKTETVNYIAKKSQLFVPILGFPVKLRQYIQEAYLRTPSMVEETLRFVVHIPFQEIHS